jgi:ERCC4-related helicase
VIKPRPLPGGGAGMASVEQPRIRPGLLEDRLYQSAIARSAERENTLVVLPTGLGKTAIALRVIASALEKAPDRSILFLAPTRPLVVQHAHEVERTLLGPPPVVLTGAIGPERRTELLRPPQIVVATPQVVANDLAGEGFPLSTFSLIVFDEAHRAVGDYPYVAIARANREGADARVLAMTASPGGSLARIREVWANLGLRKFEYRVETDPDVAPYLHGIGVETVTVPVPPEVRHLAILMRAAVARAGQTLSRLGLLAEGEAHRRAVLAVGEQLHRRIAAERASGTPSSATLWQAVTAQSVMMKGLHALDLIESQGVDALREFFARQSAPEGRRVTPSQRAFLGDPDVAEVRRRLESLTVEHPKIGVAVTRVREELEARPGGRVIVFSQFRDTVDRLIEEFDSLHDPAVRAARFVGQATRGARDPGLRQKDQVEILARFRSGEVNCLVATSVAEEGLDIPATDLVVFYEPIPDVIRTIQRRGRTGRARAGRAIVLVAEGTRDEGLHRGSFARERRMHEMLERVEQDARSGVASSTVPPSRSVQRLLSEFR